MTPHTGHRVGFEEPKESYERSLSFCLVGGLGGLSVEEARGLGDCVGRGEGGMHSVIHLIKDKR